MAQSEAQSTVQKWNRNCQEHSINSNDALVTLCVKAFETAAIVLSPTSDKAHVDYALTTLRIDREIALQFEKEGFDVLRHLSFGLIETLQVLLEVKGKNNEDAKEEPMEIMREENQMPIVDDHMGEEEIEEITEEEEPQVKKPRIKSEKKINNKRREYGEKQYSCPTEECEYITHSIVQWVKHLSDVHSERPRQLGLALLCECGNESFSVKHTKTCRKGITIVRKNATPTCIVPGCKSRPKTATAFTQHLTKLHSLTLLQMGIFLKCSCGHKVTTDQYRSHKKCNGHEYTINISEGLSVADFEKKFVEAMRSMEPGELNGTENMVMQRMFEKAARALLIELTAPPALEDSPQPEPKWQPLEGNPDTINTFLGKIGVGTVESVDVFSFDEAMLQFLPSPQLALLLYCPDYKKVDELYAPVYAKLKGEDYKAPEKIFFMRQRIANACGTFALFHSLANLEGTIDLGSGSFREWFDKAKVMDSEARSDLLEQSNALATAHEATARAGETAPNEATEHHFITYVVVDGVLYQMDSRAPFPRALGASSNATLVADAGKHIKKELMSKLDNISFSAIALVNKQ